MGPGNTGEPLYARCGAQERYILSLRELNAPLLRNVLHKEKVWGGHLQQVNRFTDLKLTRYSVPK